MDEALRTDEVEGESYEDQADAKGLHSRISLSGHEKPITQIAWRPDGQLLASVSLDGTLRLWDASSGSLIHQWESDHGQCLAWSPDGHVLATGTAEGYVILRNIQEGKKRSLKVSPFRDGVLSVSWSPDGRYLATGGQDATIRLWDSESRDEPLEVLPNHGHFVNALAWGPQGRTLASGSSDWSIRLWNADTWKFLSMIPTGAPETASEDASPLVFSLAFLVNASQEQPSVVAGYGDSVLRVWDSGSGQCTRTIRGHKGPVIAVACSHDGALIASSSQNGELFVWNTPMWDLVAADQCSPLDQGHCGLDFRPASHELASALGTDIKLQEVGESVVLYHSAVDQEEVADVAKLLRQRGLNIWFEPRGSLDWKEILKVGSKALTVAILFGRDSNLAPETDLEPLLRRGYKVVPVLLRNYAGQKLPLFLRGARPVDFRDADSDPADQFLWAVTGRRQG